MKSFGKKFIVEKRSTTVSSDFTNEYDYTETDDYDYTETDDYDYTETADYSNSTLTSKDNKIIRIPNNNFHFGGGSNRNKGDTNKRNKTEERDLVRHVNVSSNKVPRKIWTREEMMERIKDYIPLKTMNEKRLLLEYPVIKTFIRYFNVKTNQFRAGGLLVKVVYPDYIVLTNTVNKVFWSVQLKDNIIYVPHPEKFRLNEKRKEEEKKKDAQREKMIKDKLFQMYKQGRLTVK
jgi:hypothetical protein